MHPRGFIPFLILLLACGAIDASLVSADIVCPDSSYATVQFTRTFTGVYRPGQPRDVVTVGPGGIETFTEAGIIIRVYLKSCSGAPIVGLPRQEVVLFHPNLCLCPGGNIADAAGLNPPVSVQTAEEEKKQ